MRKLGIQGPAGLIAIKLLPVFRATAAEHDRHVQLRYFRTAADISIPNHQPDPNSLNHQLKLIRVARMTFAAWHVARSTCRVSQRSCDMESDGRAHVHAQASDPMGRVVAVVLERRGFRHVARHASRRHPFRRLERRRGGTATRSERGDEASLGGACRSGFIRFQWSSTRWRGIPSRGRSRWSMSRTSGASRVRGCDLVQLDATGRVIAGEPCVGSIVEDPRPGMQSQAREWILSESAGGR